MAHIIKTLTIDPLTHSFMYEEGNDRPDEEIEILGKPESRLDLYPPDNRIHKYTINIHNDLKRLWCFDKTQTGRKDFEAPKVGKRTFCIDLLDGEVADVDADEENFVEFSCEASSVVSFDLHLVDISKRCETPSQITKIIIDPTIRNPA